jgi:hypothetical protein
LPRRDAFLAGLDNRLVEGRDVVRFSTRDEPADNPMLLVISLFDGHSDLQRVQLVEVVDAKAIAIAPVEDLIADRMGQYVSTDTRVPEMLDQAMKMFRLADRLDETYLDKRIREETAGELGLEYLKEQAG